MKRSLVPVLVLAGLLPAQASDQPEAHAIRISVSTPEVVISRRATGRQPLQLPGLRYMLRLTPVCAKSFAAQALSVGIADSRGSIEREGLGDGSELPELTIEVPRQQLAPIAISNFCLDPTGSIETVAGPDNRPRPESLTIPAVVSAHVSLTCSNGEAVEVAYSSHPLDVVLICEAPGSGE